MEQVLKQFTIAFGLNNTELKQGLKDSENALSGFVDTARNLLGAWASFEFFKTAINNFKDFTTELMNAQTLTGESATNIQALGGALKRFGGDTSSAVNAIKTINQHLHDAKFGEGALMDIAKRYGVVISKGATAEQTILNLAKQMGRYDRQTRIAIASQLGLDEAMQLAFADGGKELEQLIQKQKRLNIVSPEDSKIAQAFSYALLDLQDVFGALMRDFARVILPAFSKLLNIMTDFIDFLRRHKIFVVAFFAGILIALTPILLTLGKMAVASTIAFAPFYAIGAIIASVALIFEDLLYYFQGYESVTGKLVKQFPLLGVFIEPLRPVVLSIYDIFKNIYQLLKEPSWDNLTKVFKSAGKAIYNLIELPLKGIKALVDGLIERFPSLGVVLKPVQLIVNKIYEAFKAIGEIIANFRFDKLLEGLSEIKKSLSGFIDNINPFNIFTKDEKKQDKEKSAEKQEGGFLSKIKNLNFFKDSSKDEATKDKEIIRENSKEFTKENSKELVKEINNNNNNIYNKELVNNKEITKELIKEKIQPLAVEAPKIEAPKIEAPKIEAPKIEAPKVEIQPLMAQAQAIPETPTAPMSSSIINNSNQNINNNNYNVTNNINQNISSATPKQLADSSNKIFINSINQQRQQRGSL
ncbi:MAG: hypothetical protein IJ965_04920 [Campylobacter sp.]|nr:hypothetical protein [Campylobacter sp.]